jgi:NADH:ubiquinone reductase (H+-translocating)
MAGTPTQDAMEHARPRVVIIGGGFGGLYAARELASEPVDVTLIDRRNHHLFQPLLYQVATAALSPADIASPIRSILRRQANVEMMMGEVEDICTPEQYVVLGNGTRIRYDYLVLASGAVDQYFGHPEWAELAPGLKSIDDAVEIRRRFLLGFEAAELEPDPDARCALLTTVVIGAGPTGVELAGAMAEMARHSLARDFRRIDPGNARIILLEGADRVLPAYPPSLSRKAEQALRKRGVDVRTNSIVTRIEADAVYVGEERIAARNVVWAAGVAASPLGRKLGVPLDRMGRVIVEPDLSIPGHPEVFVVGDLAMLEGKNGEPLPGLAPVAMQQGRTAARNILLLKEGRAPEPFRYRDKGSMATIGRGAAIAQLGWLRLSGFVAWLAWIFVHVFYLVGFRNRIAVLLEWGYAYLTWQRGARLITGPVGDVLAPADRPLGEADTLEPPEREDALEATEQLAAARTPPEHEKGWMSEDPEQAKGA